MHTIAITPIAQQQSQDGSYKFLWRLQDDLTVESIRFRFRDREYVCISAQVGCNIGCIFCATGRQRSLRNLTADEIYQQVALTIELLAEEKKLYQVAFAGMGEPLLNFANVTEAATRFRRDGLAETVSVSTAGIVPRIQELAATTSTGINRLFLSLHATTDAIRDQLIPLNKKYPIKAVLEAARRYYESVGIKVTATYLTFARVNDSDADLERLLALLDPQIFIVQLSEWNTIPDMTFVPSPRIDYFQAQLACHGFEVFIQRSKGRDIEGGCGQLQSRSIPIIVRPGEMR